MKMYTLSVILLSMLISLTTVQAQQKYALVIGNGAYQNLTRLNNPVNDANDMKAVLQGLGFNVDTVVNGSRVQMEEAIERFKNRLSVTKNSYGFLFYAGHGVQSGGINYLIPADADIRSESYLGDRAVSVQAMLNEINQAGNELNVVVLDACRDNPFSWSRSEESRSGSQTKNRGLQVVSNQPAGSIIVFATGAGRVAADGTGRNGLFTGHLLNNLKKPGLSVRDMFDQTGADVQRASGGVQIPAIYSQFFDTVYLGTRPAPGPQPSPAVVPPQPAPRPVTANMVWVEGGTFSMGGTMDGDEKPIHQVTVKGFYMSDHEVTQKEWVEVMGRNPSYFKGDTLPVENVSWYDAIEYCNKRSAREGLTPAYTVNGTNVTWNRSANGYRLPTEAEWEYAARGGNKNGGYEYSGSNSVDSVAWYSNNSGGQTQSVKTKSANSLGLYDMSGNVWEWCWDWWSDSYTSGAQTDPTGASSGTSSVFRGGGWGSGAAGVRSADRIYSTPSNRFGDLGFRLVRP